MKSMSHRERVKGLGRSEWGYTCEVENGTEAGLDEVSTLHSERIKSEFGVGDRGESDPTIYPTNLEPSA